MRGPAPGEGGLRVAGFTPRSRVNGPGLRAVLWVQGCSLGCPGCFNPSTHGAEGPALAQAALLARLESAGPEGLDGLTFSGGEPFEQAAGLAALAGAARARWPDLHLMAYSGYRLAELRGPAAPSGSQEFLSQLDLLVDGRFEVRRPGRLAWRGSANQRLWVLGRPPRDWRPPPDAELSIGDDGAVLLSGLPDAGLRRVVDRLR